MSCNISKTFLILNSSFLILLASCSVTNQISKKAEAILLSDTAIRSGHIGISIYEPATNTYWYNYNADKYFIPASNTKLFTLYAGMKYLGDSLVGAKIAEYENSLLFLPTGDPTFLHPEYSKQPVYDFLSSSKKELWCTYYLDEFKPYGKGWAWDDYNEPYMTERSWLPIFGNNVYFSGTKDNITYYPKKAISISKYSDFIMYDSIGYVNKVTRDLDQNNFLPRFEGKAKVNVAVPFITSVDVIFNLLRDTLHKNIRPCSTIPPNTGESVKKTYKIHSQPTDSLFKPMMHRSDNFFAEQTLLMVSNEHLGYMSDEKIIDTLLKTDLKDVPQKPRWVDGSGLSRYNLFTPQSFVYILNKTKNEFGWDRIKNILPTGGTGTLSSYFKKDSGFIYAKTGTLSNNCALSGFLITQKGKLLIFSVLTNNYPTGATPVRKAVEHFLLDIRKNY